jgi:hypothetical protein
MRIEPLHGATVDQRGDQGISPQRRVRQFLTGQGRSDLGSEPASELEAREAQQGIEACDDFL